jgi:hypothetical protein
VHRFLAFIVFLPLAAGSGFCQSRWEALKELSPGQKIVVEQADTQRLVGKFVRASDEAIMLVAGGRQVSIERDKVTRVRSNGHRVRNAVLLGVAGVFVGAAIGHTRDTSTYTGDGPGALIGGAVAGAAGALIPSGKTYYRVDNPRPPVAIPPQAVPSPRGIEGLSPRKLLSGKVE